VEVFQRVFNEDTNDQAPVESAPVSRKTARIVLDN
jgi:hypothetical protein